MNGWGWMTLFLFLGMWIPFVICGGLMFLYFFGIYQSRKDIEDYCDEFMDKDTWESIKKSKNIDCGEKLKKNEKGFYQYKTPLVKKDEKTGLYCCGIIPLVGVIIMSIVFLIGIILCVAVPKDESGNIMGGIMAAFSGVVFVFAIFMFPFWFMYIHEFGDTQVIFNDKKKKLEIKTKAFLLPIIRTSRSVKYKDILTFLVFKTIRCSLGGVGKNHYLICVTDEYKYYILTRKIPDNDGTQNLALKCRHIVFKDRPKRDDDDDDSDSESEEQESDSDSDDDKKKKKKKKKKGKGKGKSKGKKKGKGKVKEKESKKKKKGGFKIAVLDENDLKPKAKKKGGVPPKKAVPKKAVPKKKKSKKKEKVEVEIEEEEEEEKKEEEEEEEEEEKEEEKVEEKEEEEEEEKKEDLEIVAPAEETLQLDNDV